MKKKYVNIGLPEDKLIEECAEVIQAITKIKRFGLNNFHPDRPDSNNKDEVLEELMDLEYAIKEYRYRLHMGGQIMKVGHIYKKGKNLYWCIHRGIYRLREFKIVNIKTTKFSFISEEDVSKYTHIGKAIELIKRGNKK